jgi:hypothetical protein
MPAILLVPHRSPNAKVLVPPAERPTRSPRAPSPAQMQEMFAAFNAWKATFKGNIVDMGGKLRPGGTVVTTAGATDGPFVEAKEIVGGDMLVSADTFEQALDVARDSPGA